MTLRDETVVVRIALDRDTGDPNVLNSAEHARWQRMRSPTKQREFLVGRTAIRRAIGALTATAPAAIEVAYGAQGKPYVKGDTRLHFNLSHSGDLALLALSRRGPIGIDIEIERARRPFRRLANRFFAAPEAAWFEATPAGRQRQAFYRMWTLKEAYLKAIGTGLTLSSRAFVIDAASEPPRLTKTSAAPAVTDGWALQSLPGDDGYAAALCTPTGVADYRRMSLNEIIGGSP